MAKAKAITKRRKAVVNTRKITKTMELVSTARFKQSFNRIAGARPYRDTLTEMLRDLAQADLEVAHPLLQRREPPKHVTILLLTANRGLAGGFNSNLIRLARARAAELRAAGATVDLHVVGKKGLAYFRFAREPIAAGYTHFGDRPTYADVEVFSRSANTWTGLPPMSTPRHGMQGAVVDGAFFVPGGATRMGFEAAAANEVLTNH